MDHLQGKEQLEDGNVLPWGEWKKWTSPDNSSKTHCLPGISMPYHHGFPSIALIRI